MENSQQLIFERVMTNIQNRFDKLTTGEPESTVIIVGVAVTEIFSTLHIVYPENKTLIDCALKIEKREESSLETLIALLRETYDQLIKDGKF